MYWRTKLRFMVDDLKFLDNFYDQKYNMYSLILKIISLSDSNLASDIHSGKIKRAFLFSNFIFPCADQKLKTKSHFHVYFTSPYKSVFNSVVKNVSKVNKVSLNGFSISLIGSEVQVFQDVPNELTFLSPFVLRDKDGRAPDAFDEKEFIKKIKGGIIRTAESFSGVSSLNFDVKFVFDNSEAAFKRKRYRIKDTVVRAWSAVSPSDRIVFSGDPLAKMIALFYGIGDRTHMGFGMLGLPRKVEDQ